MRMALEVTTGIQHDQRADARDQQKERQGQAIDQKGQPDIEGRHPAVTASDGPALRNLSRKA